MLITQISEQGQTQGTVIMEQRALHVQMNLVPEPRNLAKDFFDVFAFHHGDNALATRARPPIARAIQHKRRGAEKGSL
eukprot:5248248-Prymnesium_polylepis.2